MTMLSPFSKLLSAKAPASADLASGLDTARAALIAASAELTAAEAAYRASLLVDDAKVSIAARDRVAAADVAKDRAEALVEALEGKFAEATAREAEAARLAAYADARAKRDAAAKRLVSDYPDLVTRTLDLLRAIAEADLAVDAANADLPAGAEYLSGPEAIRDRPSRQREVIREREVYLWTYATSGQPLPDDKQVQVRSSGNGTGFLASGSTLNPGGIAVVKRRFRRVEFRPYQSGDHMTRLAGDLNLPPLRAADEHGWRRDSVRTPTGILAELDRLAALQPVPPDRDDRPVEVEFIPIPDREPTLAVANAA